MRPSVSPFNRSSDGWIVRYGFAVLMVACATIVRIVLKPIIPTGFPFLTFFLAVILAAWRGGLGPGLLASVLSTLAADLLLIEPIYEFHLAAGYYWVSLAVFVVEAVSITIITERMRQAQSTLRESETRFQLIADAAPVLIWIADPEKRCTYFNKGWLTYTGRTMEQELEDGWTEGVHPDDYERCLKTYVDAFDHRQQFAIEYRRRRTDGRYGWILDHGVPLWGNDREFRGYIGACVDITERKQAEANLSESEGRLRLAMQGARLCSWETDLKTEASQWDDRLLALIGLEDGASKTAPTWSEYLHPNDQDNVLQAFAEACEGRGVFDSEFRVKHADGSVRWLASWGHLMEGEESIRMVGLVQDITERKHMEEALRKSEARLRSILNRAPAAIFIKDSGGRYLFMNEECARVLGVNHEHYIGLTDRDLLHADLAAQLMANDQRVWESEQLLTVEEFVSQADGIHTSLVKKFLLRDEQGQAYALSGIALDITARLQLEAAIQGSEARLQLAQSAANIGVFDWDIAMQKGIWSPELERMWGLPVGGFDGTAAAWRRLVHPDDLPSAHAGIQRSLEDPAVASGFEYRMVRPDGAVRWIYAKAKALCNEASQAVRIVGVNLDITERKEAQLRLERFAQELEAQVEERTRDLVQSQKRLRAMTSELNLAEQRERKRLAIELHDHLQQMLVVGKLLIGQGKRSVSGVPTYEAVLKKVDDILSEALAYSRTLVAELSPVILREKGITASLTWLADYMKKKHEHHVTVLIPYDQDVNLPEDQRVLLFQSVRELLINSAKHAGTGEVILSMATRGDHLWITVKDEGNGFEVTETEATKAANDKMSSHFGLYSIQERMRAMGGSFEIQSTPGKGTTANLILPLSGSMADHGATISDSSLVALRSQANTFPVQQATIRLLIVDDHVMIRQGLRTILEAYPDIHVLGEAANGEEALTLAQTLQPDVVLMDINMPKMNGIEATAVLKGQYPRMSIVGLSVNADRVNADAMIQAGADALLTKEAPVEELYQAIKRALKTSTVRISSRAEVQFHSVHCKIEKTD